MRGESEAPGEAVHHTRVDGAHCAQRLCEDDGGVQGADEVLIEGVQTLSGCHGLGHQLVHLCRQNPNPKPRESGPARRSSRVLFQEIMQGFTCRALF